MIQYLRVPRDFETVTRSLLRRTPFRKTFNSYGLLSGETFKEIAKYHLVSDFDDLITWNSKTKHEYVFIEAIPTSSTLSEMTEWLKTNSYLTFPNLTLIVHNGDQVLPRDEMEFVSNFFKSVFSVNINFKSPSIFPIPLGLENQAKMRNGVQRDFAEPFSEKIRDIDLLVAFSTSTNPEERIPAEKYGRLVRNHFWVKNALTPRQYRKVLARAKYVLSPPGNGIDCHRTWEALYFGAVPIVLRSAWAFSHLQLPVIEIDAWEQLTSMDLSKPHKLPYSDLWRLRDVMSWLNV